MGLRLRGIECTLSVVRPGGVEDGINKPAAIVHALSTGKSWSDNASDEY